MCVLHCILILANIQNQMNVLQPVSDSLFMSIRVDRLQIVSPLGPDLCAHVRREAVGW